MVIFFYIPDRSLHGSPPPKDSCRYGISGGRQNGTSPSSRKKLNGAGQSVPRFHRSLKPRIGQLCIQQVRFSSQLCRRVGVGIGNKLKRSRAESRQFMGGSEGKPPFPPHGYGEPGPRSTPSTVSKPEQAPNMEKCGVQIWVPGT